MKKFKICFFFFSIIILFSFGFCKAATNGKTISLEIAPLYFDLNLNPGQENSGKIYIENKSENDWQIDSEFSDFFVDNEGKYIFPEDKDVANEDLKPYLMKSWLSINKENFLLKKGESQVVDYTIKVPNDSNTGGHYGAIFFKTRCDLEKDKAVVYSDMSQICVSGKVGVLFLVQVGGDAQKKGEINKVEIPKISIDDKTNFSFEISNKGNTHFKPEGSVVVESLFGRQVYQMEVKDKTVLPTVSRTFEGSFDRKGILGIYSLKGDIFDGDGNEMVFKRWFIVFSWQKISIIALILAFLAWFGVNYRFKKREEKI